MERNNISIKIFEQLNKMLIEKSKQSNIINHNLEKGLGNEEILRQLLNDFLPTRYGIAKGKVSNSVGTMSKQCDIIVYDKINCPTLFIDENNNQILPIEGVYCVFEIKTTINRGILEEGYKNLLSVHNLLETRTNRSVNELVDVCPPGLEIIAFKDNRHFDKVVDDFKELSNKYSVKDSFHSYSKKSPGFKKHTGETYLVSSIVILNKGIIYHLHDGSIRADEYGEYTLGIFLTGLLMLLNWIKLPAVRLLNYFNWFMVENLKVRKW